MYANGKYHQDSILEQMTLDAWQTATRPKVHGSLNLHKQFSSPDVDFFIMLSSLSGVTGFVSQSNYAAGNTFQDALARHRMCSGLHAASVDIGIVNSVGYLIEHREQMERLRKQQYHVLSEADVLGVIEEAIVSKPERQMLLGLNGANLDNPTEARFWSLPWRAKTTDAGSSASAGKASSNNAGDLAGVLSSTESFSDAVDAVRNSIVAKLMDIFMIDEAEIDPKRSVSDLGVDSLVAVELRNLLALRAGAKVSIFDIMSSASLNALAENITTKSSFVDASLIAAKDN